jgi:hypothetical protein
LVDDVLSVSRLLVLPSVNNLLSNASASGWWITLRCAIAESTRGQTVECPARLVPADSEIYVMLAWLLCNIVGGVLNPLLFLGVSQ